MAKLTRSYRSKCANDGWHDKIRLVYTKVLQRLKIKTKCTHAKLKNFKWIFFVLRSFSSILGFIPRLREYNEKVKRSRWQSTCKRLPAIQELNCYDQWIRQCFARVDQSPYPQEGYQGRKLMLNPD